MPFSVAPSAAAASPRPSGRKGNRKVRTGCITCKIRKVKCDEGRPFCARCTSTGRRCDGYLPARANKGRPNGGGAVVVAAHVVSVSPTAAAQQHHMRERETHSSLTPSSPTFLWSPSAHPLDPTASRLLAYYHRRSVAVLDGLGDAGGSSDRGFWGGLVLRLAATEPAVRHAVVALAALHEAVVNDDDAERGEGAAARGEGWWKVRRGAGGAELAFREYGRAIAELRQWRPSSRSGARRGSGGEFVEEEDRPGGAEMVVPLVVCVLFVCIEFLADDEVASQLHICQGRKVLSRLADDDDDDDCAPQWPPSEAADAVRDHLAPMYTRLGLASYLFGSVPRAIPAFLRPAGPMPAAFGSAAAARGRLYQVLDEALAFTVRARQTMYQPSQDERDVAQLRRTRQQLLAQLARWHAAFAVFTAASPAPNAAETTARHLLDMYYAAGLIWISVALDTGERAYDDHTAEFGRIVSHAAAILHAAAPDLLSSSSSSSLSSSSPPPPPPSAFSFETELIAPLYWTCTKCRHPLLRRAALRLLMRPELSARRENLWHGREAVVCAARVVHVEEEEEKGEEEGEGRVEGFGADPLRASGSSGLEFFPGELAVPTSRAPSLVVAPIDYAELVVVEQQPVEESAVDGFPASKSGEGRLDCDDETAQGDSPPSEWSASTATLSLPRHRSKEPPPREATPAPLETAPEGTLERFGERFGDLLRDEIRTTVDGLSVEEAAALHLDPPFGIPEHRRVKNELMGPRQTGGTWLTLFREPLKSATAGGEALWRVKREFLKV